MSTPTLNDSIQKLREEHRIAQKRAEIALDDKIAELLNNLQQKILNLLEEIEVSLKDLGKEEKESILSDESIVNSLSSLGFARKKPAAGRPHGNGRYNESAILAFLADGEKEQKQITSKFAVSKQSIVSWGKKLVESRKVEIKKAGRERIWSKV